MVQYKDKVHASEAELRSVLKKGLQGFSSSLPPGKGGKELSEEVVTAIADGVQQYLVELHDATIDQISGRIQKKLKELGLDGVSAKSDAKKNLTSLLGAEAGSDVMKLLNAIAKNSALSKLIDFFENPGDFEKNGEEGEKKKDKDKDEEDKEEDKKKDNRLPDKKEFAKYLDKEIFPYLKFFQEGVDRIIMRVN